MVNPIVRGWINYYGRFYKSGLYPRPATINEYLVRWATTEIQAAARPRMRACEWLGASHDATPTLFAHWRLGVRP